MQIYGIRVNKKYRYFRISVLEGLNPDKIQDGCIFKDFEASFCKRKLG